MAEHWSSTAKHKREKTAQLRVHLADNLSGERICEEMGLTFEEYDNILEEYKHEEEMALLGKTTERVYVEYCLNSVSNIRTLNDVLENYKTTKQHSSMVAAVKAKQDIYDSMIKRGQEFGFVEKKPEQKQIAGVLVNQLSNTELRRAVVDELSNLDRLFRQFGDDKTILDLDPGPLHMPAKAALLEPKPKKPPKKRDPLDDLRPSIQSNREIELSPAVEKTTKKPKGHAKNKVFKGRRKLMPHEVDP